jgi:hypothetical protein
MNTYTVTHSGGYSFRGRQIVRGQTIDVSDATPDEIAALDRDSAGLLPRLSSSAYRGPALKEGQVFKAVGPTGHLFRGKRYADGEEIDTTNATYDEVAQLVADSQGPGATVSGPPELVTPPTTVPSPDTFPPYEHPSITAEKKAAADAAEKTKADAKTDTNTQFSDRDTQSDRDARAEAAAKEADRKRNVK